MSSNNNNILLHIPFDKQYTNNNKNTYKNQIVIYLII